MGKTETTSESSGEAKKKKKMIETTPAPSTGYTGRLDDAMDSSIERTHLIERWNQII